MPAPRAALGAAALLAAALGCSQKGRSLVLVDLSLAPGVAITNARVVIVDGGGNVVGNDLEAWTGTPTPLDVGVFVSKDVAGSVHVIACGLENGAGVATGGPPASTNVSPGATTAAVVITLSAGTPDPKCANGGGSDGGAGSQGAAGAAGGGAGSQGAAGAAGGVAPDGGADSHGAAGTIGAAGAGGAGTAGAAGAGAPDGGAGSQGAAGAGGAAGAHMPGWLGAQVVAGDLTASETVPAVAVSASGKAVVVYDRAGQLWANTFDPATATWGQAHAIDSRSGADGASVAVDTTGHYLAVWNQDPQSANKGAWWSSSSDGVTWSPVASLTTTPVSSAIMAMNSDGAAIVAWTEQTTDGNFNNQAAASVRSATGGSWSAPQVLRPGDDQGDRDPAVAMSGKGEAFVMWQQLDGQASDEDSIWWRQHTTAGWSAAALFETYDGGNTYNSSVAANAAGQAVATWVQASADGLSVQIWERRYTVGAGFGGALEVAQAADIDTVFPPSLTLDESGIATVAWAAAVQSKYQVFTDRAAPTATTWPAAMEMETDNAATNDDVNDFTAESPSPIVRNDPTGNVTLVWRKRVGARFDVWGRRLSAGGVWGNSTLLETRDIGSAQWLALGVGADGTAIASWYYDVELDVWANVYR